MFYVDIMFLVFYTLYGCLASLIYQELVFHDNCIIVSYGLSRISGICIYIADIL